MDALTYAYVKLLLPPRQSRGVSQLTRQEPLSKTGRAADNGGAVAPIALA